MLKNIVHCGQFTHISKFGKNYQEVVETGIYYSFT